METINEELVNILKSRTPEDGNTVEFLMDIIPLGKEAAYRRLRGDVSFTLDEATTICKKLNISVDLLLGIRQEDTYAFHLDPFLFSDPINDYNKMLYRIKESMDFIESDPSVYLYRAHRTLPQEFLYNYRSLSKIYLYILYYQVYSEIQNKLKNYSEFSLSDDVFSIQKESTITVHACDSMLILDRRIFIDYIEIVNYFKTLEILTQSDIDEIKKELFLLIDDMEKCATTGLSLCGKKMDMYISHISFDCSYTCLDSASLKVASIGLYCLDYLSSQNRRIHENQKNWIKSLMRFSTLISVSGELQRNKFFQEQRDFVESM